MPDERSRAVRLSLVTDMLCFLADDDCLTPAEADCVRSIADAVAARAGLQAVPHGTAMTAPAKVVN
jgi:hypothetical protein